MRQCSSNDAKNIAPKLLLMNLEMNAAESRTRDLPPVCRALESISLHLRRTESDVPGARGNAGVWVVGSISTASPLLLELLLELERITEERERESEC